MSRAYSHPMQRTNHQQLGCAVCSPQLGISFDFWDEFREETLDPWVNDTLESVGLDESQIQDIKSDVGTAFDRELKNQQEQLIQQVTGGGGTAPASTSPPVTQQIANTISDLEKSAFVQGIPGGIYTIAGVTAAALIGIVLVTRR